MSHLKKKIRCVPMVKTVFKMCVYTALQTLGILPGVSRTVICAAF